MRYGPATVELSSKVAITVKQHDMAGLTRSQRGAFALAAALVLAMGAVGCGSTKNRAPVEDRVSTSRPSGNLKPSASGTAAPSASSAIVNSGVTPSAAENAVRPGYYTVKPGDTLIRIGLDSGQNWKDLVRWNGLANPDLIETGQVLRIVSPNADPSAAGASPIVSARVDTRPLEARPTAAVPAVVDGASVPSALPPVAPAIVGSGAAVAKDADDDLNWLWPAAGPVTAAFDEAKSKGLAIAGKAGDPVLASADGRVVYAGSGLRGYGNLVILKHNNTYLTAYAHNQTLLVKDDQAVRRGQKIAEMGSTDSDRVQLHFEIRKQGRPVDPAKLLPQR